ncbi:MAG: lysophospholipase [Methylovulum sp.]|uniref:alpha/beta hydrolase n=1 Tax=Methylovulum sp. TaxID=1916980 RepID=UPI00262A41B1|nr:alpha/beta hydrolase [Methylovulum sp.]MDD2724706.1 lysophospholipase [Methylovulum sp.]MDD5124669.1 lysophospholipase [Methylovulum sp.]
MKHIEGYFTGIRDASIYYQAWLPEGGITAVLIIVHGLGEHCGRYLNVVQHFVPLGYAVYGFDHIGHGKSEGQREVVDRFEDYTDTLSIYHHLVRDWQPDKPFFLIGHSMGGLIAGHYLLAHQDHFNGAVISSPCIKVSDNIPRRIILIGKILSVLSPRLGLMALDTSTLSRDPEVVSACARDPLVFHGKTPARLAAELLKAMQYVSAEFGKITLPLIILQGSEDKIVDPDGARTFYEQAGSKDKALKIYMGLYHEVFNEPERAQVLNDVETWLLARQAS